MAETEPKPLGVADIALGVFIGLWLFTATAAVLSALVWFVAKFLIL